VGVAIVPASVRKLRFDGVVYRPMSGATTRSQVWAVWRPDRLPAPARAFAEYLGVAPDSHGQRLQEPAPRAFFDQSAS
jgi:DNA-binding transcriptional LysR family regulator